MNKFSQAYWMIKHHLGKSQVNLIFSANAPDMWDGLAMVSQPDPQQTTDIRELSKDLKNCSAEGSLNFQPTELYTE